MITCEGGRKEGKREGGKERGRRVAGEVEEVGGGGTDLSELGLLLAVGHMVIALQIAVHHLVWEYAGMGVWVNRNGYMYVEHITYTEMCT